MTIRLPEGEGRIPVRSLPNSSALERAPHRAVRSLRSRHALLFLLGAVIAIAVGAGATPAQATSARRDTKSPVTTSDARQSYESRAEIRLTATDKGGSGVASTTWRVNRSAWMTGTLVEVTAPGEHTLEFTSTDEAGNEEAVNRAVFVVGMPPASIDGDGASGRGVLAAITRLLASSATWVGGLFSGEDGTALAAESVPLKAPPRSSVSAPRFPTAVSRSTPRMASGVIEPAYDGRTGKVRIYQWLRTSSGDWEDRGYVTATLDSLGDRSKYSASISLSERGIWRLRTYHPGDAKHGATWSQPIEVQSVGDMPIALTFDDGPDPRGTPEVLASLRDHNARASFFLLGWRANKYPENVRAIAEGGHQLGNHRYTHKVSSPLMSSSDFRSEVERTNKAIERALSPDDSAEVAHRYPIDFRYPWGKGAAHTDAVLDSLEMTAHGWSYGPGDGGNHGPPNSRVRDLIARKVLENARPYSVILLHDSPDRPNTVAAVPIILSELERRGYDFVTLEDLERLTR